MKGLAEPGLPALWHTALFYRGADEFESAACGFAQAAAEAGAPVLIACTGPGLGRLMSRLDGLGDRVTWADMASMGGNPGRLISAISRFADQHRGRPVWCVQEAAWSSRPQEEIWEVIRHEALTNLALAGGPVRLLCPYDVGMAGELISCAEATHPVIVRDGRSRPSSGYRGDDGLPVPRECDRPLAAAPPGAGTLRYHHDLTGVRQLVSAHARAAGLPANRSDDLMIAVSELAANTLAHTSGPGTLTLWATGTELICQIDDTGHISDPLAGRLRPDPAAAGGGRGLWLVHQLCDLVQIRTGPAGTTVRVRMRLAS